MGSENSRDRLTTDGSRGQSSTLSPMKTEASKRSADGKPINGVAKEYNKDGTLMSAGKPD